MPHFNLAAHPDQLETAISRCVDRLQAGQVVVFPTMGVYGLGADAFLDTGIECIFQIKQRPLHKPLLVLIADPGMLSLLAAEVPNTAQRLITHFWPGQVTLIFRAHPTLSPLLTGHTATIGIRQAAHPVTRRLIQALGHPITGTSANRSGQTDCCNIAALDPAIQAAAAAILDVGALPDPRPSTVVDITGPRPVILREGRIAAADILSLLP